MKKLLYTLLFIFFFAACSQKDPESVITDKTINALFVKAGDLKYPQQERISFLDQVNEALAARKYDTIVKENYFTLANLYNFNQDKKKQLEVYKKLERRAIETNDVYGNIQTKCSLGNYYFGEFSNDSAFYYYAKAEKLSKKTKGNPVLASILQGKADLLWCQKDYAGAEATATKALKIAVKKKGYEDLMFSSYLTIANSLVGMNKNEKALEYYNKALENANFIQDPHQKLICKASTYNYIALVYQKRNQHQKAIDYIDSNTDFNALRKVDLKTYSYLLNTKAYSKFKLNDRSALSDFKEVLQIAESTQFMPAEVAVKLNLSEYYLSNKDTASARLYGMDAQKSAHQHNIFEDELKAFQLLADIVPSQHSFYNERYIVLNDSLQSIERATRDKFARIEFETDEIVNEKKEIEEEKNILLKESG